MGIDTVLLSIHALASVATFVSLATYRGGVGRWKMGVSLLASVVCGAALASIFAAFLLRHNSQYMQFLPWLTGVSLLVALRIVKTRGNMARAITITKGQRNDTD